MLARYLFAVVLVAMVTIQTEANELKIILGKSAFLDEATPFDHFVAGGSYSIFVKDWLWIEPQFVSMNGPGQDRDYVFAGGIGFNIAEDKWADLYIIVSAGILHHRNQFFDSPAFSGTDWTANGGLGVKLKISDRLFIAPEFRMGFEPFFLATVGIGYKF